MSGKFMDSRLSKLLIGPFARKNRIETGDYILDDIRCFNDFFCRRIREGLRPVSMEMKDLISPADGLLSTYRITSDTVLSVKQSSFNISKLLRDEALAKEFEGGYALVFRLCVEHYHRYIFFDSGKKLEDRVLPGFYHTVRPVALEEYPVFTENSRRYAVIDTENFGKAVQMEVGATLVGKIVNERPEACEVRRGEEKGHFEYGGSTIIVLLQQGAAKLREDIEVNLDGNVEIPVKMGEVIGRR